MSRCLVERFKESSNKGASKLLFVSIAFAEFLSDLKKAPIKEHRNIQIILFCHLCYRFKERSNKGASKLDLAIEIIKI